MTIGSLFAGIGGFDLAGRWMGWDTKWFSEIEPYASSVLKKHWPNVPNHGDITKIKGEEVEHVDILCGGFPCQDVSGAGKGAGLEGERSGLWFHYARLIKEIQPRWIVAENVSLLRSRGLDRVLGSLSTLGYDAEWHCIPASYVGAPHRRDRIWIVAHAKSLLSDGSGFYTGHRGPAPLPESGDRRGTTDLADTDCFRLQGLSEPPARERESAGINAGSSSARDGRTVRPDRSGWAPEPNVGRVVDGVPARVDRLRCLGNAIVPQVAHLIFQAIALRERGIHAGS